MAKKWYVVHVFSGSEKKVCQSIEEQIVTKNIGNLTEEVLVPTEEVVEIREGKKIPKRLRLYPGYIMVNMALDDDAWFVVRNTPGLCLTCSS
jgi:transcriptional antiterminator NusG